MGAQGTSLFCFTVVIPATYEDGLVAAMKEKGQGIFGCDEHAVYYGAYAPEGQSIWFLGIAKPFPLMWGEVKEGGKYKNYDWTVKAEPDVVFLPGRLRQHLQQLSAPSDPGVYIKTSYAPPGLLMALQIYSKGAMEKYVKNHDDCAKNLLTQSETEYMMICMESAGIKPIIAPMVLLDQTTSAKIPTNADSNLCADIRWAAYHPFQAETTFKDCLNTTTQAKSKCPQR